MVTSKATTVAQYLKSLPPDRRAALEAVREVILEHLPDGYEEGMQYGMIGYYIPLARYPNTYNGQALGVAALASQKAHMSLYLMGCYGEPELQRWFEDAYARSGKKLDMGKSCVRFKRLEDLPLEVVGEVIGEVGVEDFIAMYERSRAKRPTAKKKPPAKG